MIIDTQTLLLAQGAVVTVCGIAFILNNVLRQNDDVGRTWSIAFVAGILTTLAYAVWGFMPDAWWAVAAGNGALALSLAAMWSGCRLYNDRPSRLWVSLLSSGFVVAFALVEGPDGGDWAGATALFIAVGVFSALAGFETTRSRLKHSINARMLTVVFWALAAYYCIRMVVFLVSGENGNLFRDYFGTAVTTFVSIVTVILSAIAMSVLTTNRVSRRPRDMVADGVPSLPGVLAEFEFEQHARNWLVRAQRERDPLVLVFVDIANLDHMNTAFGHDYGDEAIRAVARISLLSLPSAALVGHVRGKRFVILTTAPAVGNPMAVAEHLHTALVETPIDPTEGIRAVATCGLASTATSGYSFPTLHSRALAALAAAIEAGPGSIKIATTSDQSAGR